MGIFQSKSQEEVERENQAAARRQAEVRRQQEIQVLRGQQEFRRQQEQIWILERQRERQLRCRLQSLSLSDEQENRVNIKKITKNPRMIQDLLQSIGCETWTNKVFDGAYVLENLDDTSYEFQVQKNKFTRTNKPCFKVNNIEKVYNPYLFLQFKLKEKHCLYRRNPVETKILFHGTKEHNLDEICKSNFNWRLTGTSTGHRFGKGVSFTPIAKYATHYGDKNSYEKVMFIVKVQVGDCCYSDIDTVIPQGSSDTTMNTKGTVYVKYDDNTFYPSYIVYYEGFDTQKKNNSVKWSMN